MRRARNASGEDSVREKPSPSHSHVQAAGLRRNKDYRDFDEKKKNAANTSNLRFVVQISLAFIVTAITYWVTPNDNLLKREAEHVANAALAAEHELEREMMDWWAEHGHQKPPIAERDSSILSDGGLQGANRWVEGEKKLKKKLKLLAERQQQGKDIGVPVLTRWLGDDVPAWAGEGVNVEDWRRTVDEKYKEMRQEEVEWQKQIKALLESDKNRG
ncbi:hypothetical protein MPSEU_000722100 [Mayamaea pseudoterrestris]|nr:hypothetical protein MPSEU_000722100 [Mayamaea pseudoterrestris]